MYIKIYKLFNLQISKIKKDISETTRMLSIKNNVNTNHNNKFKERVAGLTDGVGNFYISKLGYIEYSVVTEMRDISCLYALKNNYGGDIVAYKNKKAIRYRLHNKKGLLNLINDVNGHIRNPIRLIQLNYICVKYDITLNYPEKLTIDNGWLSGFFDADATITINSSNWQLSISAGQKTSEILTPLVELFGGYVYIDRGGNGSFKWYVTKKEDILKLIEYFKKYPSRSAKNNRLHLVPKLYELKGMKAHIAPSESLLSKSWDTFIDKWNNYE